MMHSGGKRKRIFHCCFVLCLLVLFCLCEMCLVPFSWVHSAELGCMSCPFGRCWMLWWMSEERCIITCLQKPELGWSPGWHFSKEVPWGSEKNPIFSEMAQERRIWKRVIPALHPASSTLMLLPVMRALARPFTQFPVCLLEGTTEEGEVTVIAVLKVTAWTDDSQNMAVTFTWQNNSCGPFIWRNCAGVAAGETWPSFLLRHPWGNVWDLQVRCYRSIMFEEKRH